tara:strand:+ start:214 stop:537 length:324 start_codon:yes stop_codon:yes gene_type:complete
MTEQGNANATANIQTTTSTQTSLSEPSKYNVILLNDDYTPMDFVTELLTTIFRKTKEQAEAIMLKIHDDGKGVAGNYVFEIAEQKAIETTAKARSQGHPLNCTVEKE